MAAKGQSSGSTSLAVLHCLDDTSSSLPPSSSSSPTSQCDLESLEQYLFSIVYAQFTSAAVTQFRIGAVWLTVCSLAAIMIIGHKIWRKTFWIFRRSRGLMMPNAIICFSLLSGVFLICWIVL